MLKNYLTLAFKNLARRRFVAGINLFGLSVGIAVGALIALFIRHEHVFDRFHDKAERIARLNTTMKYPGASESTGAFSSYPMGPFMQEVFDREIETYCRLTPVDKDFVLQNGDTRATIRQVFSADSTFFRVFGFRLRQGDPLTALTQPQAIVLTRKVAESIFHTPDALGKTLSKTYVSPHTQHDTTEYFTVSGVLEDLPATSHLQFDALLSGAQKPYWAIWNPGVERDWQVLAAMTYFLLRSEKTDLADLEKQIPEALAPRMQGAQYVAHHLQALTDIHGGSRGLTADKISNFGRFDRQYVQVFSMIGLFVLLIAAVNYANLCTILAGKRAKEIAIRKTVGANRRAVITQFLTESVLTTALAAVLAGILIVLSKPWLAGLDYPVAALDDLTRPSFWAPALVAVFALGIVAGIYPAFFIGKMAPSGTLRGQKSITKGKKGIIPVLVTAQFVAAIALIASALICYRQIKFLEKANLGYSTDQILTLDLGMPNLFKGQILREKLEKTPGVLGATVSDQVMGNGFIQSGVRYVFNGKAEHVAMPCMAADEQFTGVFQMQLSAGRTFSREATQNTSEYLINETLARQIGWNENAVGQQIAIAWQPGFGTVVGVLKDFHFNSLHHKIEPVCIRSANMANSISLKVATAHLPATFRQVEVVWKSVITDWPFEYTWADKQFAQVYQSETRFSRLTGLGAALAVFIACLGLLGLVTFMAEQRVKEIGIRKVLGASVVGITGLLAKDFLKLVVIAIVIAAPVAYFFMDKWLTDFAYRIEIQWWMFALAGLAAVAIAFLTVGFQSVRAAWANPVESLRSE
ncbi:MAG: ABC transporter permease [Lewinellaceae bacterium]|nr:ABC transporter permease [Lewinellaceae bacterium]